MVVKTKRHVVDIGKLKHRITFQRQVETPDSQGGRSIAWQNVATVWAYIKPVNEYERIYAQSVRYLRTHKIMIRFRNDIDTSMQILYGTRIFQVKAFINSEEDNSYLVLDCEENVGT